MRRHGSNNCHKAPASSSRGWPILNEPSFLSPQWDRWPETQFFCGTWKRNGIWWFSNHHSQQFSSTNTETYLCTTLLF
jgi:hypothetical protein